jgi:hypothetical protein
LAAPPGWQDGSICSACSMPLPRHAPDCPYRRSLSDSIDTMSGVAAPLLAGFSIGLIGIVLSNASSLRWPGWTLLPLTVSVLCLITAVQGGFWVRHYRPDPDSRAAPEVLPEYRFWLKLTQRTYNGGIAILLMGLAVAMYPDSGDEEAVLRRVSSTLAALAAVAEVAWALIAGRISLGVPRRTAR